jgi:MFS family permease
MSAQFLRAYILVRFVSLVAEHVATFVIPVAIYLETRDVRLSGLAYLLQWLPQVIALPMLGHLADRFAIRRQFVGLDLLRAGLAVTIPFWSNEVAMMAMIGLLGLASGHNLVVMETFLARHCPPALIPATQARVRTAYQSAVVLGPALGGLLIGVVPVTAVVLTAPHGRAPTPRSSRPSTLSRSPAASARWSAWPP